MSQSLIRRGLDLYKDDVQRKNTRNLKSSCHSKQAIDEEMTKVVGTNKQGYRRKVQRLKVKRNEATLKDKKVKSHRSLHETHTRRDMTKENLKALKLMKLLNKDEKNVMEQAAQRHQAKSERHRHQKVKHDAAAGSSTEATSSVFTESDFKKFFEDYNFT